MYKPLMCPLSWNVTLPISHSGLSQGTYLTNNNTHFKEIRDWVYQKYVFCHEEDILTPYGPLISERDPTYPHSGLSQDTYLTNKHNHFKETRGSVCWNNN